MIVDSGRRRGGAQAGLRAGAGAGHRARAKAGPRARARAGLRAGPGAGAGLRVRAAPRPAEPPDVSAAPRRLLVFGSVAAGGFALQLAVLVTLAGGLGVNYLLATALAVEAAIVHNFFWHHRRTWSDRRVDGAREVCLRFARYNAGTALTSIGGNLLMMWILVSGAGLHYALANAITVPSLALVNFAYCDLLVFRRRRETRRAPSSARS